MVKHYWQGVHKGVALCRSGKKALETEQRKTSVASGVESGVATGGAGEGGAFPEGSTNAWLKEKRIEGHQRFGDGTTWGEMDKQEELYDGCSRGMWEYSGSRTYEVTGDLCPSLDEVAERVGVGGL